MNKNMRAMALLGILAVMIGGSLVGSGIALYDRFQVTNTRRAQQTALNRRFDVQSRANCEEIETLKAAQRERAQEAYKNLDKTLTLLHLTRTPALVATAQETRDRDLARFKAEPCPRVVTHPKPKKKR